jgi:hypothetical protein
MKKRPEPGSTVEAADRESSQILEMCKRDSVIQARQAVSQGKKQERDP